MGYGISTFNMLKALLICKSDLVTKPYVVIALFLSEQLYMSQFDKACTQEWSLKTHMLQFESGS